MRLFRQLLILAGIVLLGLDIYLQSHGSHLCPYEGCRIVAQTPFATLKGYPLTLWGLVFFVVALIFSFSPALLGLWCSLGLGFSAYMVYLQVFVIERLCQMCLLVEAIVLLLFLSLLDASRLKNMLCLFVVGLLGTHALYTFPPGYVSPRLADAAVWKGKGEYRVVFFFDPLCPACERAYQVMREHRELWSSVTFRSLAIHKGSLERAVLFYGLCLSNGDPWAAFEVCHSREPHAEAKFSVSGVDKVVEENLRALQTIGVDAVPAIFVCDGGRCRVFVGYRQFSDWVASVAKPQQPETTIFQPIEQGVCTPKKECY